MKLYETTLPQNYSDGLFNEKNYDLGAQHTDKVAYTLFTGVSNILKNAKSKDHPVSFDFTAINGNYIAGAIVRYIPNEDASKPGNWNLVWTFNEADIPENTYRINIKNQDTYSYFRGVSGDKYGMRFRDSACLVDSLCYFLLQLHKWLDENAKENEIVMIEQDAIFQARVSVENGEKIFALEPAGEIKMLVKDDASIEK